jgi:hypothetical protein
MRRGESERTCTGMIHRRTENAVCDVPQKSEQRYCTMRDDDAKLLFRINPGEIVVISDDGHEELKGRTNQASP